MRGMTAWTEAAPKGQAELFLRHYRTIGERLAAAHPDVIVALTVEHWANFFLNNMPAFCIGRAEYYDGPVEDWLKIPAARVAGDPLLAQELTTRFWKVISILVIRMSCYSIMPPCCRCIF